MPDTLIPPKLPLMHSRQLSLTKSKRVFRYNDILIIVVVFILGPSHHTYLVGCSITQFDAYDTPFGRIPINKRIVTELNLPPMSKKVDESEHSIELQIPFLKYVMKNREFELVPILIGDLNDDEMRFAELFKKYLIDETCLFIISSDFCHCISIYYPHSSSLIYRGKSIPIYIHTTLHRSITYSNSWIGSARNGVDSTNGFIRI